MLQWGTVTSTGESGTTTYTRNFSAIYTVVTTMYRNSDSAANYVLAAQINSVSTSSFSWYKSYANRNSSGGAGEPFRWIAIGKS